MTSINIKGTLFDISTPAVMGILNITPDSFYDGGEYETINKAIQRADEMIEEGAKIIDIGGYSTRPGASDISENEEIIRAIPVIEKIKEKHPKSIISIDTFRRNVAEKAVNSGADIVNDISGGELDKTMFDFILESKTPYIMMHIKGNPQTMSRLVGKTTYTNILTEMLDYFNQKIEYFKGKGFHDVIIDPGFGFAKTIAQNYFVLKNLDFFLHLQKPILVGVSRKSMIYKTLNIESRDALPGTIALNMFSLQKGASILRVHDVKEAVQTVKLFNKLS